ncbi:MAG: AAA family ATPase, partial [Candidatus Tectomicrobia bacterium]|nr:AAA family ATPase [Candidatus Tectomicrobia bacterium]
MTEQQGRLRPGDWLAALPDLKKSGNEHHGPCPVCGGTDRFRVNDKGAFCRKGCAFQDLSKAVFGDTGAAAPTTERHYRRYTCEAPDGKTAVHVRLDAPGRPKQVWWEAKPHAFKTGNFLYFPSSADRKGTAAVICEGEKDADAAASALPDHRVIGTVTGAASAPAADTLAWGLRGAGRVVLWPDADDPGLAHMRQIAQRLPQDAEALWANTDGLSDGRGAADCTQDDRRRRVHEAAGQTAEQEAVDVDRPRMAPLSTWKDEPEPAPVLWRDADGQHADAVLSVGEVALLSGEGGLGKSYVTLALAVAGVLAADLGRDYGEACGLRVMPGPVALVSYEDSPARIYGRLGRMGQTAAAERIHSLPNPPPLWTADSGASREADWWGDLWQYVRGVGARLVIVDPASAALADADVSQTGPVRKFLRALMHEARQAECGVLVVSHSTKAARNALRRGDDPGAGVVAGSAAWYDGARGVLSLEEAPNNPGARILECVKANYGRKGWGTILNERTTDGGAFAGLELESDVNRLGPVEIHRDWMTAALAWI